MIEAKTRKLRASWSFEVAQDLKAMYGFIFEEKDHMAELEELFEI